MSVELENINNQILQSNSMGNSVELENGKDQKSFLETTLGKAINTGLDIGIRALLPDLIENQAIEIKNAIFENGFSGGIKEAIDSAIDLGKSVLGIFTGNFENVSQVQNAISSGGIIDSVSDLLDLGVEQAVKNDLIPNDVGLIIKRGKNVILDNVSSNIENTLTEQVKGIEKLEKYTNNWNQYYKNKNFEGMEREFDKMQEQLKVLLPLEDILKKARQIENVHNLIKNNGQQFDISENQLQLSQILV